MTITYRGLTYVVSSELELLWLVSRLMTTATERRSA